MNETTIYYIGDLAKELGLSQRTIRYYEELGFIKPTRTEGGFRTYSRHNINILKLVVLFKELGLALDDIRGLLIADRPDLNSEMTKNLREVLSTRRKEFELKIKKYEQGISQIDDVLSILSNCTSCGRPLNDVFCKECLKKQTTNHSTIITPMLDDGDGEGV